MAFLFIGSKYSATNANGAPLAGGKVYTYLAGTLTPQATFTDQAGLSPNTNPVVLDASGRANIWLGSGTYRFIVKDASDVIAPDGDTDNITSASIAGILADTVSALNGDAMVGVKSTLANAVGTTQHQVNEERVSVFRLFTPAQIADVTSNAGVLNVQTAINAAVDEIAAQGKRPYLPAGTYLFDQLSVTRDCEIETEGLKTIFKRTTASLSAPHVLISANVVFGDVTGVGNIAADTLEFSHFIQVTPASASLELVEFGHIKCSGYRGDGLYVDGRTSIKIKKVKWKGVNASNMWRSAVSIIGATDVEFGFVDGNNSCGYRAFNVEPNPGISQATSWVKGGYVINGRVQFAGDASIPIGTVDLDRWYCDAALQVNSTPPSSLYDATSAFQQGANFARIRIGRVHDLHAGYLPADYHAANGGILEVDHWVSTACTESTFKCHIRDDGLSELRIGSGTFTPTTPDIYIAKGAAATRRTVGYRGALTSTGAGFSFGTNNAFQSLSIACAGNVAFNAITKSVATNCNVTACAFVVSGSSDFSFRGGAYTYSGGTFDTGGSFRLAFDWITSNAVPFIPETAVTYSASMAISAPTARTFSITANNGSAFTVNDPTEGYIGQLISIKVRNTSGGALGTLTWGSHYRLGSWTQPATGNHRTITFAFDGSLWNEQSRTATDVSN